MEKKRKYNEHILQVENASFITLAFSVNGGKIGKEASKCYSQIAKKLAEKQDNHIQRRCLGFEENHLFQ